MARYQDLARKMVAECPGMRVARATRVLSRVFNDEFRAIGLQVSQHGVLTFVALAGKDGATIGALAEQMVLDPTTLTRNLRPLQKAGYLTLTRSPRDGRAQIVALTKKGEKTVETIFPLWQRAYGRLQAALGPRSLAELSDHLDLATAAVLASPEGK
jgi:DNA-binding MarR family transcriptional regulator